jgi:hypothetical protein
MSRRAPRTKQPEITTFEQRAEREERRALWGPIADKPLGSPERAWSVAHAFRRSYTLLENNLKEWIINQAELDRVEAWRIIPTEEPFGSREEMYRRLIHVTPAEAEERLSLPPSLESLWTAIATLPLDDLETLYARLGAMIRECERA